MGSQSSTLYVRMPKRRPKSGTCLEPPTQSISQTLNCRFDSSPDKAVVETLGVGGTHQFPWHRDEANAMGLPLIYGTHIEVQKPLKP